ncbi:MAG: FtsX-like permease family protein [Nitrososphaerota archaeon]|nr:FtsX-like permease family protein [Nitrososphaerota archaeon]
MSRGQITPVLLAALMFATLRIYVCEAQIEPIIYGRVTDAVTGQPIIGATVIIWDLNRNIRGVYQTSVNGEYMISGSILLWNDQYLVYAFRGNLTDGRLDYVPGMYEFKLAYGEVSKNVSMQLLPGASITIDGSFYSPESSSLGERYLVTVNPELGYLPQTETRYLREYGDSSYARLLGISRRVVVVPANIPIKLVVETAFLIEEYRMDYGVVYKTYSFRTERLTLDDFGRPFNLTQAQQISLNLSEYSLRHGMNMLNNRISEVSSSLDEAQRIGFVVFEDRSKLAEAESRLTEAGKYLERKNYTECWVVLSDILTRTKLITLNLNNMKTVSITSAVYMPAILAIFSVILAFFFFENEKRKLISSIMIYTAFLGIFYIIYPGAHLIMDLNRILFIESAVISVAATLLVVFGVPKIWKERQIEGEVSLKSAVSILFSMGKRQIRRKKLRGFFTILSTVILVLAFVSLTSFGTVFDIVAENINVNPGANGILVKRLQNATSILSSPLPISDMEIISGLYSAMTLSPRFESSPSMNPIAQIINPANNKDLPIYGIEGVSLADDPVMKIRTGLISMGRPFNESVADEIIVSSTAASILGLGLNQTVYLSIAGVSGFIGNFTVVGIFSDSVYAGIIDLDGQSFGPIRLLPDGTPRVCNATEVILMHWKTANMLQEKINEIAGKGAPQIAVIHEIIFQPSATVKIQDMIKTLIYSFHYDVFISSNNIITHYFIGSFYEIKGAAELIIPLAMVILNIGTVMLNAVYERRGELRVLSMLGLNPAHIRFMFLAEAIIVGMVGGGVGYLFGLGFYRIATFFGQTLMVREKLEWWWSAIGFAVAMIASVISAIRPAILAVRLYTPSMVRKFKLSEQEQRTRREEIFKVYQAKEVSMPVKILPSELPFFCGLVLNRLEEMKTGAMERVEEVKEIPEIENVKGELVKAINFNYYFTISGTRRGTNNELICIKSPGEDYYRVRLKSKPAAPGMPEDSIDRTIDFVHSLCIEWSKNKKRIIGG